MTTRPMRRDRPYTGQAHTDSGERGKTEIRGITFRDLRDCFVRAVLLSAYEIAPDDKVQEAHKGEDAELTANDLYGFDLDKLDPGAIANNLSCEVERAMGIFPNVRPIDFSGTIEETLAQMGAPMISLETAANGGLEAVMSSPEMSADAVEWKARAVALWNLLDEIDHANDMDIGAIVHRRHQILEKTADNNFSIPSA